MNTVLEYLITIVLSAGSIIINLGDRISALLNINPVFQTNWPEKTRFWLGLLIAIATFIWLAVQIICKIDDQLKKNKKKFYPERSRRAKFKIKNKK